MKISKLKIKNFKAFYGEYEFNFCDDKGNAKNILIYGENGSGKSSLYWVLHHIFNSYDKFHNVKKYKNIFAKEENLPLEIEVTFDNGNYVVFDEKNNKVIINEAIKKEFEKLQKLKIFLSYNDIFLLNELFKHDISLEKLIQILKNLYGSEIEEKLKDYEEKKEELKNYINQKCKIEKNFLEFRQEYKEGKLLDEFMEFQSQYEDIERWDKEGDFIGYDTIYYYSDEVVNEYNAFLDNLKTLNEELNFRSEVLENLIYELEDIKEHIYEKSIENNEEKFSVDKEEIETINVLEMLKDRLDFVEKIINSYDSYKKIIKNLNDNISLKLEEQIKKINNILKTDFGLTNIDIKFINTKLFMFNLNNLDEFRPLKLRIEINKSYPKYNHLKFLNEAKISSINFAFYLSMILSYVELDKLKILVLDDLLISLDMSNRDTILDILLKYFSDYQIIILTHDKAFFEMAKQKFSYKFSNNWKYFEMYLDNKSNIEKPLILPHRDYFQKAEYYLIKHDYPTCANYLRKEAERLLKKLICNGLDCEDVLSLQEAINKSKHKSNFVNQEKITERVKKLIDNQRFRYFDKSRLYDIDKKIIGEVQTEIKRLEELIIYEKDDLNEILNILEQFKSIILNPQSHDDITKPLYKKELEEAIKIIKELKNIIEYEIE